MAVKLSLIRTKTLESATADGLDGVIAAFTQTLGEEKQLDPIQFEITRTDPLKYVAFITYTNA